MKVLRVAIDLPLPQLFDYRYDDAESGDIGRRVLVPFGKKKVVGIIVEVAEQSELGPGKLRDAERILHDTLPLAPDWMELARFCSGYYQRSLGEVMLAALPPRLRSPGPLPGPQRHYEITAPGREALQRLDARSGAKRALLATLNEAPLAPESAASLPGKARAMLRRFKADGWVREFDRPRGGPGFVARHQLTAEQQQALDAVGSAGGSFGVFLLFGITGSGKTEVYLRLIADCLERGRQSLILVPEIALTPALEAAFAERFPGADIVVQHSGLPAGERAQGWLQAQSGRADIVLGTRLAVFAPLPRLGLIVVDEEQDASFKQQESLRYSARDVAIVRARSASVPAVLCSATPSLETWRHARSGRYALLRLSRRAHSESALPEVRLIDTRATPAKEGISEPLAKAIAERLARREQGLIFLNRRGYAPVLSCIKCAWVSGCARCSARLVLHLRDRQLRCHHCGHVERVPRACPECGNLDLQPFGRGTQRLEASLAERFPGARILRIDRDTARRRGALETMFGRIDAGGADILVGTQILAKGHHFERLTLVGVVDADAGLFAADYRAPERMFAQLEQVSGRAGRVELAGEVLVQTNYPHHSLYQALVRHDYEGFAQVLLEERQQAGFPPFVCEAALRAEARAMAAALKFLREAAGLAPRGHEGVVVFDPSPMLLERLAGRDRAQLIVQARSRTRLQQFLREWSLSLMPLRPSGVRWHLDVDPTEF